ncbi:AGAP007420-PA-like protein [Anopheles sinensis]|uniref:AGAP007420-PA-like protein n=1 Tax=Anopheles sinensis TaxID=74873 RepID=A0A084WN63_ANOSI|nr:AGAP007420-PA-like protein [Anopheles sinensis]
MSGWLLVVLVGCLTGGVPSASGLPSVGQGGENYPVGRFPILMPKVVPYKKAF